MSRINQLTQTFENPIHLGGSMSATAAAMCGVLALAPSVSEATPTVEQSITPAANELIAPIKPQLGGFMLGGLGVSVAMPESHSVATKGKVPTAVEAANKHCAAEATARPSVMAFGLEKGKKSTYIAKYALKALDASCSRVGTRVAVYRFMVQPGGDGGYISTERRTFKTNKAISRSTEMRFGPNWCKNGDVERAVRIRLSIQTDWKSKYGSAHSKTKQHYTKPRTTCEDDVRK